MSEDTLCTMPFFECPHCGAKWEDSDWYFRHIGDSIMCPECEGDIYVVEEDVTVVRQLSATDPDAAYRAARGEGEGVPSE